MLGRHLTPLYPAAAGKPHISVILQAIGRCKYGVGTSRRRDTGFALNIHRCEREKGINSAQTGFQLRKISSTNQTPCISPFSILPTQINLDSSNSRSGLSSRMCMLNIGPKSRWPTSRNLGMHRINTTILRSLTHRQRDLGRHDTDHQTRDLVSVFLGAICEGYAPVQVVFQVREDVGFI